MFGRIGTHFFAFDLLWLEKTDLRPHPLEQRKSILRELLGAGEVDPLLRASSAAPRVRGVRYLVRILRGDGDALQTASFAPQLTFRKFQLK